MKISIIIPVWNGKILLEKNLPIVLKAVDNPKNNIAEVILVDDASPDDSIDFVKQNFKDKVRVVRLKKNRGFSGAVNMGVYASKHPLICLLNMDVLPSTDFLEKMQEHFQQKDVFAVTLHEEGYGPAVGAYIKGFFTHRPGVENNEVQESMWASGGSAVFKRSIWLKLKGLDEELFAPFYWEDVDIGYRAWKRGFRILWEPRAKVLHKHESVINSDSFSRKYLQSIKERNYLLFMWKNFTSDALWKKHKWHLYRYTLRHPGYLRVVYAAWKKRDVIKKRREIEKKQCKTSDEAIFSRF